jgi:phosphoribosylformylglycinamidine (FGAM) synthase PurS component
VARPLPCLVGGAKAFRLKKTLNEADWLALLRALAARAERGLERLDHLERLHRKARTAIAEYYRPGALPSLLALTLHQPVLSPQAVARLLDLTVTGASKLLERAQGKVLVIDVDKNNFAEREEDLGEIIRKIDSMLFGLF